jgi:hypothetical protein
MLSKLILKGSNININNKIGKIFSKSKIIHNQKVILSINQLIKCIKYYLLKFKFKF